MSLNIKTIANLECCSQILHGWNLQQIKTIHSEIEQMQTKYYGENQNNEKRFPVALGLIFGLARC